jgi:hypothetical protein
VKRMDALGTLFSLIRHGWNCAKSNVGDSNDELTRSGRSHRSSKVSLAGTVPATHIRVQRVGAKPIEFRAVGTVPYLPGPRMQVPYCTVLPDSS